MATKFKKDLATVPTLSKEAWTVVADKTANEHRRLVVDKKWFSKTPYTPEYRRRKQARKAAPKGVSVTSASGVPDLQLTGKLMQALKTLKASGKGATYGWFGSLVKIVEGNALSGRDLTEPKLLDETAKVSRKQIESALNGNIRRTSGKITVPVNIKF